MLVVSSGSPYVSTVYQNKLDSLIPYVSVAGQATQNFHGGSLKYQFAFLILYIRVTRRAKENLPGGSLNYQFV